jgi:hypothetical protein
MIPKEILEVLEKFNWDFKASTYDMKSLLEHLYEEHGAEGMQASLHIALEY